ncbi:flagellar biosynthesis protein FlgB [Roseospira marina]|uniref:Flagellar basal body rod protein FlgB n=1 Tax=Roseospira marina TaxID=140057 RepID=A0A5M6I975_9PROT|nr:flagellar biosynthesis protein FlgB [Roseospira marina]KAA5604507.1 flagellar biosynthesis protein FlgB [Roseospira marina]MBB4315564.1 flagellar basal-body rod protein FlgB [Roseospira marina]MBB5088499.1 flagellar basal-body rod protein FlgB [Roseospira marina]
MDLTNLPFFRLAKTSMDWSAQRQRVLAQNVAQMDTPNYRPSDVAEPNFKRLVEHAERPASVKVAMTDPGHQPGTLPEPDRFRARVDRRSFETTLDDNAVVLEEQTQKMGETKSRYLMASNLFERNLRLLKAAIGRDSG